MFVVLCTSVYRKTNRLNGAKAHLKLNWCFDWITPCGSSIVVMSITLGIQYAIYAIISLQIVLQSSVD